MTTSSIIFFIAWIGSWYKSHLCYAEKQNALNGALFAALAMIFLAAAILSIDFPFMQVVPQ